MKKLIYLLMFLVLTISVYGVNIDPGLEEKSAGSVSGKYGWKVYAKSNFDVNNITLVVNTAATRCYILDSSDTIVFQNDFVGDLCTVEENGSMVVGNNYSIVVDNGGVSYAIYGNYTNPPFEFSFTQLNITHGYNGGSLTTSSLYAVNDIDITPTDMFFFSFYSQNPPVDSNINTSVNLTYLLDNVGGTANCTLFDDDVSILTVYGLENGTHNFNFNSTFWHEGDNLINLTCIAPSNVGSEVKNLFVDTVFPSIQYVNYTKDGDNFTLNNAVINWDDYLTFKVQTNDTNNYFFNLTVYRYGTGETLYTNQSLNITPTFNFNNTINLENFTFGYYIVNVTSKDAHTKKNLNFNNVLLESNLNLQSKIGKELDNTVKIYTNTKHVKKFSLVENVDRKNFVLEFNNSVSKFSMFIEGSISVVYVGEKYGYNGHFIIDNKYWYDLENKDGVSVNSIKKLNNEKYEVVLTKNANVNKVIFDSIGLINVDSSTSIFLFDCFNVNISSLNIFDNSQFLNYTVNITGVTGNGFKKSLFVNNKSTILTCVPNGTYYFNFSHNNFYNKSYTVNSNLTRYVNYTSYQAILTINASDVSNSVWLTNFNVTLNNSYTIFNYTTGSWITLYLNSSNYTYVGSKYLYNNSNGMVEVKNLKNNTLTLNFSFLIYVSLFDEKTGEPFNVSSPDSIEFLVYCPTETASTIVNNSNQSIPINCPYQKFRFIVNYDTSSYYRSFLIEPGQQNYTVYLIDLATTSSIYNSFIVDDLLSEYLNTSIIVRKKINNVNVQITGDTIDIENKIGAFLIENSLYNLEIHSSNKPTLYLGEYGADVAGDKVLRLYSLGVGGTVQFFYNDVKYSTWKYYNNNTNDTFARGYYEDSNGGTVYVNFTVWQDNYGDTLLYTTQCTDDYCFFSYNITPYVNHSIYAQLAINNEYGSIHNYVKQIVVYSKIILPIMAYYTKSALNWTLIIILGVIALMASYTTANKVAMAIVGLASLFIIFGWLTLSIPVLVFSAIVSLFSMFKEGDRA